MKDGHGTKVQIDDIVELWPDHIGRVVCAFDDAQFDAAHPETEWGHLKSGVLIELKDGNLFHYETPDEDFRVLRKAARRREKIAR